MLNLNKFFQTTLKDSQRSLFELASEVIEENRVTFDGIAETVVNDDNGNIKEVYRRLVKELFSDGVIHKGRVIVFLALKIFIRDRFSSNIDEEAGKLMIEHFPGWIEERQSIKSWNSIQFYVGLACAVFSIKLIKAIMLSHFFSFVMLTIMERQAEFDPRLKHPFTCMVVGPTQCGKTCFVLELIHRSRSIHPSPERIIWCFGCYQDLFRNVNDVEFVEGVPDMNILDGGKKRTLLITDDLMSETDSRVTKIFTKWSHHLNGSVIYISQNLFNKSKENRNTCLNTHYLVLFKNSRDSAQVMHLGRQIFPDAIKYVKESFADATSLPYSYLPIDLRTITPDLLRLRTDIFSGKRTIVYVLRL